MDLPQTRSQRQGKAGPLWAVGWPDYHARQVDPAVGRMWAVDPLAGKFAPVGPWSYALNNPLRFVDPTGMAVVAIDGGTRYTGADAQMGAQFQAEARSREKDPENATYRQNVTMTYKFDNDGSHILNKTTEYKKWMQGKKKTTIETTTISQQFVTIVGKDGTVTELASEIIKVTV